MPVKPKRDNKLSTIVTLDVSNCQSGTVLAAGDTEINKINFSNSQRLYFGEEGGK